MGSFRAQRELSVCRSTSISASSPTSYPPLLVAPISPSRKMPSLFPNQAYRGSRLECLFVSIYKYSFLASQGPSTSRKTNLFTWSQAVLLLWKDHKLDAQKTTRPQVYRCQIHNLALLMPMAFGFIFSPENARREHISTLVPVVCLPFCIASSRF